MRKQKPDGHVTVEEADALFRRPLELLRCPAASPELILPGSRLDKGRAPGAVSVTSASRGVTAAPESAASGALTPPVGPSNGHVRRLRRLAPIQAAPALPANSIVEEPPRQVDRPVVLDDDARELADRLEGTLVEASCLAAELRRRHRDALTSDRRVRGDLRELATVLLEQFSPNDADTSPTRSR